MRRTCRAIGLATLLAGLVLVGVGCRIPASGYFFQVTSGSTVLTLDATITNQLAYVWNDCATQNPGNALAAGACLHAWLNQTVVFLRADGQFATNATSFFNLAVQNPLAMAQQLQVSVNAGYPSNRCLLIWQNTGAAGPNFSSVTVGPLWGCIAGGPGIINPGTVG
ncbi:MAG: hypothetical protein KIT14_22600 [bacterium]|nr:hypothetical protein [bacterium]